VAEVRPGVWELRVSLGRIPRTGAYDRVTRTFEGSSTGAQRALAKLGAEVTAGTVKVGANGSPEILRQTGRNDSSMNKI